MATRIPDDAFEVAELEQQCQALLSEIGRRRGSALNPATELPMDSDDPDIRRLLERYTRLARQLASLRSQ
ncbi:MAG: hypothetical protein ACX93P_15320 [Roseovarius sp.]